MGSAIRFDVTGEQFFERKSFELRRDHACRIVLAKHEAIDCLVS
jgi:hypothetical protein